MSENNENNENNENKENNDLKDKNTNFKSKEKEYVKNYNLRYYEQNKTKILKQLCEKKECQICNKLISKSNFSKHCLIHKN